MFINEVEINPNYIQTVVDKINSFLEKKGYRQRFKKNIRDGNYHNARYYQVFFDWDSGRLVSDEEEKEIEQFLKRIQNKIYKDMNILMVFNVLPSSITINFRNWYFKRMKPPKYLYHSTRSLDSVKEILKNGLIPKETDFKKWSKSLAYPKLIFFETEPSRHRWGQYVFKIDTEKLPDHKFYTDINLDARGEGIVGGRDMYSMVTNKSIPSDKIELLNKEHVSQFLDEGLNLKSRASEQEKQREEYIRNILKKDLKDITESDLSFVVVNSNIRTNPFYKEFLTLMYDKIKNYFRNEGIEVVDKTISTSDYPGLLFLGNEYHGEFMMWYINGKFLISYKGSRFYTYSGKQLIDTVIASLKPKNKIKKNIKESLNLKSRANDNLKQKANYIKQKGINDETRDLFMKDFEVNKDLYSVMDERTMLEIEYYVKNYKEMILRIIPIDSEGNIQHDLLRDIMYEENISLNKMMDLIDAREQLWMKERRDELKWEVEYLLDEEFNEVPTFQEFYQLFKSLDRDYTYSENEVRNVFLSLTTNPNQLSLFENEKQYKLIYAPTGQIIIKGHYRLCNWKLSELKKTKPTSEVSKYKIVRL